MGRAKPPHPSTIDKLKAKAAAPPSNAIDVNDVGNVLVAARRGLAQLGGDDLVNVALSMRRLEAVVAAHLRAEQAAAAAADAQPAADPATPPPQAAAAKG